MRSLIDAARQSGGNDETGLAEIARQGACEFEAGAGGVARADDRDDGAHQHVQGATHAEQRRRIVKHRKPRRITGFARREQADAEILAGGEFGACVGLAINPAWPCRAAAPRQIGQMRQRACRIAEMAEQGCKCARADIVGTDQPETVEPFDVGELVRAVVHAAQAWLKRGL